MSSVWLCSGCGSHPLLWRPLIAVVCSHSSPGARPPCCPELRLKPSSALLCWGLPAPFWWLRLLCPQRDAAQDHQGSSRRAPREKCPPTKPPQPTPACMLPSVPSAPNLAQPRSPWQALPAHRVGRRRAVGLLDAVDEGAGQAGLAAMMAPAVLKLPGRASNALRIPSHAITTVLQDTRFGLWQ